MYKKDSLSVNAPQASSSAPPSAIPRDLRGDFSMRRSCSFIIDATEGEHKPCKPMSSRLQQRREAAKQKQNLVDYTDDESMLIAEILRESHIGEKKHKASTVDVKIFDASRRRMCKDHIKEQAIERKEAQKKEVPDASDRRQIVKELAAESRRRAAIGRSSAAV